MNYVFVGSFSIVEDAHNCIDYAILMSFLESVIALGNGFGCLAKLRVASIKWGRFPPSPLS